MYEVLLKSLCNKVPFSEEDLQICKSYFVPRKVRRRQYLLQEGDVCSKALFIEKGSFYSYTVDDKGIQHVVQFGFKGWWIADLYSLLTKEPSKLNIEALEDSEVLLMDWQDHYKLYNEAPKFESYMRILYQDAYVALQRRIESTIGLSAEEKYQRLLNQYHSFINKVPLHLIASYLGVSPETLSRIRKQMVNTNP
jgi:CRP-like cAMP-binding protein